MLRKSFASSRSPQRNREQTGPPHFVVDRWRRGGADGNLVNVETWVALVTYDILSPPTAAEEKSDPFKGLRAKQDANREALLRWCTDGSSFSKYSESAYAVTIQLHHLHDPEAARKELIQSVLKHELHEGDRIVVQELCGFPAGGDEEADALPFRAVRAALPVALGNRLD